jgi:adenosylhomocysteine nucleosidase
MTLRILVTFALDLEFSPWRKRHAFARVAEAGFPAYEGEFGEAQVRVALTGVGGVRAKTVASAAFGWRPDICVAAGLAGSLREDYGVGQILAARDVMELESSRIAAVDETLFRSAEACGAVIVDRLLTASRMVASAEDKKRLGKVAGAVEMESFAVLAEAAAHRIPAIAIRAISDDADEDLPMNFDGVLDENGNVIKSRIASAVVRAPHKLPALVRLGRQSRGAAAKLAAFLDRYVSELAARSSAVTEMAGVEKA